ncbi:MAG: gliding motility-associated C-terminal domain-containing protein, partial [Phaeodactylibacter sp.]|nr:gliding motility-associated C-terminal domain-containing protein [Phaeodactylibacter sp.]
DNLSYPIDTTYDIVWDFGDGNFGDGISPTHTYVDDGIYTVSVEITSPIGCYTDTIFYDLITVLPSPTAGFSYTPEQPNNFEPTVQFIDESIDAKDWRWTFGEFGLSFQSDPSYTFPDTGFQLVTQIVTHESGCTDTAQARIDVEPQVRYFLPNAFTPNGDGLNDLFRGEGVMKGAVDFDFQVWNRYGELVFQSSDPFEAWNGRKHNTGELSPRGVYVVIVRYTEPRGRPVEIKGFATLIL